MLMYVAVYSNLTASCCHTPSLNPSTSCLQISRKRNVIDQPCVTHFWDFLGAVFLSVFLACENTTWRCSISADPDIGWTALGCLDAQQLRQKNPWNPFISGIVVILLYDIHGISWFVHICDILLKWIDWQIDSEIWRPAGFSEGWQETENDQMLFVSGFLGLNESSRHSVWHPLGHPF